MPAFSGEFGGGEMPNPTAKAARSALTPEMSRLARQELGMSQVAVSKASEVPTYVIKQWEAGRFLAPTDTLSKLAAFYKAQGVDLDAITDHVRGGPEAVPALAALPAGFTGNARPGFFVDSRLPAEVVSRVMERLGTNDDRIGELLEQSFRTGFLGGTSEETESAIRELFGSLAESYLLFRFLQGRNVVAMSRDQARAEPQTIGDYLSAWAMQEPGAADVFAADPDQTAGAKPQKPAQRAPQAPAGVIEA